MSNYQRTAAWLHACGKAPSEANASLQIGCHIEEFVEFLGGLSTDKEGYAKLLARCMDDLDWFATKLKTGASMAYVEPVNRKDVLDALCDCEITGNGVAYMLGMNKEAADLVVLDSNESKLNADGTAVILPGGKIGKSDLYRAPDLTSFV